MSLIVDPGILLFGVRIRLRPLWIGVFVGKRGYLIIGKEEDGGWQEIDKLTRQRAFDLEMIGKLEKALERMTDLVRYQRHELHNTGLITDEEYTQLIQHEGAVSRLEGYDAMRKALAKAQQELAIATKADDFLLTKIREAVAVGKRDFHNSQEAADYALAELAEAQQARERAERDCEATANAALSVQTERDTLIALLRETHRTIRCEYNRVPSDIAVLDCPCESCTLWRRITAALKEVQC